MSRTGKIARLPSPIRETLNHRLEQGEPSNSLVQWLNTEPTVRSVLAKEFDSHPISESNLSQWKNGGHQDWKAERAALAMFERIHQTPTEKLTQLQGGLIDQMATLYAAQLLAEMQKAQAPADDAARAKMWREFRLAFASLRRYQFTTIVLQNKLKFPAIDPERSQSLALTEEEKRSKVEALLGVAGTPDANRFDLRTQSWSGPNADVMNQQHRQLLLKAAQEAGLEIPKDQTPV